MQKKQSFKELYLKDLESTSSFEDWVKKSLNFKYQDNEEISKEHLIIYLDYIENKIKEVSKEIDYTHWVKTIIDLRKRIDLIKRG